MQYLEKGDIAVYDSRQEERRYSRRQSVDVDGVKEMVWLQLPELHDEAILDNMLTEWRRMEIRVTRCLLHEGNMIVYRLPRVPIIRAYVGPE